MSVWREHLRKALLHSMLRLVNLALVWDEGSIGEDSLLSGHDGRVVCVIEDVSWGYAGDDESREIVG